MSVQLVGNSPWAQLPRELNKEVQSYLGPRDIATRTQLVCQRWHMPPNDLAEILISQIRSRRGFISSDQLHEYVERLKVGGQIPRIMGAIKALSLEDGTRNSRWLQLQHARQLEELGCSFATNITDDEIRKMSVSLLPSVTTLDLSGCIWPTDQGFQAIMPYYPNINSLSFYPEVTDDGLAKVMSVYKELQAIQLYAAFQVTDEGVGTIAEHCPNLRKLYLIQCDGITDLGLQHLARLTHLQQLHLSWCGSLTNLGLQHLTHLQHLQQLKLKYTNVTDDGLPHLAHLPHLQQLDLMGTDITDDGLPHLAHLPHLQQLSLQDCEQIKGETFGSLQELPLKELDLSDCKAITRLGFASLALLSNLEELYLTGCDQISTRRQKKLKAQLPNLVIIR